MNRVHSNGNTDDDAQLRFTVSEDLLTENFFRYSPFSVSVWADDFTRTLDFLTGNAENSRYGPQHSFPSSSDRAANLGLAKGS